MMMMVNNANFKQIKIEKNRVTSCAYVSKIYDLKRCIKTSFSFTRTSTLGMNIKKLYHVFY